MGHATSDLSHSVARHPKDISYPIPSDTKDLPTSPPMSQSGDAIAMDGDRHIVHKGMVNGTGLHHCFLNVVIQSLWHTQPFRDALIYGPQHIHPRTDDPCIRCQLTAIFAQYEYSDVMTIPPDGLRAALHQLYHPKFQLFQMADAEEAFDAILRWIHCDTVRPHHDENGHESSDTMTAEDIYKYQDSICSPLCMAHVVFGTSLCDYKLCPCGASSEPELTNAFLYRVYAAELIKAKRELKGSNDLAALLRQVYQSVPYSCPDSTCSRKSGLARWCLCAPIVFPIMLVWPQDVDVTMLTSILQLCSNRFDLSDFMSVSDTAVTSNPVNATQSQSKKSSTLPPYQLMGMILYYGRHYVAMFWSIYWKQWIMFDDTRVKKVGQWQQVYEKCIKGRLQPIILYYTQTPTPSTIPLAKQLAAQAMNKPKLARGSLSAPVSPTPTPTPPHVIHASSLPTTTTTQPRQPQPYVHSQPVLIQQTIPSSTPMSVRSIAQVIPSASHPPVSDPHLPIPTSTSTSTHPSPSSSPASTSRSVSRPPSPSIIPLELLDTTHRHPPTPVQVRAHRHTLSLFSQLALQQQIQAQAQVQAQQQAEIQAAAQAQAQAHRLEQQQIDHDIWADLQETIEHAQHHPRPSAPDQDHPML